MWAFLFGIYGGGPELLVKEGTPASSADGGAAATANQGAAGSVDKTDDELVDERLSQSGQHAKQE